jgi:hypothetical protein
MAKSDPKRNTSMALSSKSLTCSVTPFNTDHIASSFGFQDGISQPLLVDVDKPATLNANKFMVTDPGVIIVPEKAHASPNATGERGDPSQRPNPNWMKDGSFLVFRKLAQSVERFKALTSKPGLVDCKTDLEVGAKLMGRWQNGMYQSLSLMAKIWLTNVDRYSPHAEPSRTI